MRPIFIGKEAYEDTEKARDTQTGTQDKPDKTAQAKTQTKHEARQKKVQAKQDDQKSTTRQTDGQRRTGRQSYKWAERLQTDRQADGETGNADRQTDR